MLKIMKLSLTALVILGLFLMVQMAFASHKDGHEQPENENHIVALNETIEITDLVSTVHDAQPNSFEISLVEIVEISEAVLPKTNFIVSLFETVSASDSFVSSADFKLSFIEQVNITDAINTNSIFTKSLVEQVNIQDQLTTSSVFNKSLIEQVDIIDQFTTGSAFTKSLFEQVDIDDTIESDSSLNISLTEQVSITDLKDTKSTFTKFIAETVEIIDVVSSSQISFLTVSLTERVNISDLVELSIFTPPENFVLALNENIEIADSFISSIFTPPQAFAISLDETIDIIDGVTSSTFTPPQAFVIGLNENVTIGDVILLTIDSPPSTNFTLFLIETIQSNDSISAVLAFGPNNFKISIIEMVIISDTIDGITPTKIVVIAEVKKGGKPCSDCKPPELVKFTINGQVFNEPRYHQTFEQNIRVGESMEFAFEILENRGSKHVKMIQLALGLPVDDYIGVADTRIILYYAGHTNRSETVILDKNDLLENVTTSIIIGDKLAYVSFNLTSTKIMEDGKIGLKLSDNKGNGRQTYFQGLTVFDDPQLAFAFAVEPEECKAVMNLQRDWCGWQDYKIDQTEKAENVLEIQMPKPKFTDAELEVIKDWMAIAREGSALHKFLNEGGIYFNE